MNKKALIAMSGGVDSSVSAYIMKERGYECMGVTMRLYHNEDVGISNHQTCCSLDDVEDARHVAYTLGIPYHVFNFSDRFKEDVIDRFIQSYEEGITPNPCIDCNRYLKFNKLFLRARELGYDYVVTGHYANIDFDEQQTQRYLLKKGLDEQKDQSYVLYSLTQEQLAHTIFPLGALPKTEVRRIAEEQGFINARKHDSQDICFVPEGHYTDFIRRQTGKEYPEGDFVDMSGNVLGRHKGIIHYTIGQRKGLGLALPEPMYVANIDVPGNRVVLARDAELYSSSLIAHDINLIALPQIPEPLRVKAKVRYRHKEQPATVIQLDQDTLQVTFDEPQRAITKGQAVVLYDGDIVIGGGQIAEVPR